MATVVITGGSRGIGAAAVELFAGRGDRVVFLYEKNHEAARAVAEKTGAEAIRLLMNTRALGGSLLLNVGPDARGRIPEESLQILGRIGKWMRDNSESIYGCGAAELPKPENGRITAINSSAFLLDV